MFSAEPYRAELRDEWDDFVRKSRNGTFLFDRGYMDYHAHRFRDDSLVWRNSAGQAVALLPASRESDSLSSHGGLTYGGLVLAEEIRTRDVLCLLQGSLDWYRSTGATSLLYKCVPRIYHRLVSEDDLYALFRLGATLVRRDVSSTVQPAARPSPQTRRTRGARKARSAGLEVAQSLDFASFWPLLTLNLEQHHGACPAHSLDEISLLARRFPEHIKLFVALEGTVVVAGTVIYETSLVAHAQYIGASDRGRDVGALDLLFEQLIAETYRDKAYFDFGISTESEGTVLNEGLIDYKEGHGATATVHDFYRMLL